MLLGMRGGVRGIPGKLFGVVRGRGAIAGGLTNSLKGSVSAGAVLAGALSLTAPTATLISPPSGFSVPFAVNFYKSGGVYSTNYVASSPINEGGPGVTTYYIDTATGSDSNPGTSAQPFKTFYKAASIGRDVAPKMLLKVKGGIYPLGENLGALNAQATTFAVVPWDGQPIVCTSEMPTTGASWTLDTGATYYASTAGFGSASNGSTVWDSSTPDTWGDHKPLLPQDTLAACRSTVNAYYLDTAAERVYVHTQDGRAPDVDIHVFEAWGAPGVFADFAGSPAETACYFEGVSFLGGGNAFALTQTSETYKTTAVFKNCAFKYTRMNGAFYALGKLDIALVNCVGACSYGDVLSYQHYAVSAPQVLEIGCEARTSGCILPVSVANQGSTMHNGGTIVRLNSNYHHNQNDQVADVQDGTQSWLLGCVAGASLQTGFAGFRCGNGGNTPVMTLDGCSSSGLTYDIISDTGATVYYRNYTGSASNSGGGDIISILPRNIVAPSISGTVQDGETLTASDGTWQGVPTPTLSREWLRGGSTLVGTGTTYVLQPADVGVTISLRVTGTNTEGTSSVTSSPTGVVTEPGVFSNPADYFGADLKMWVTANDLASITKDGSNNITAWADKGPNARTLTASGTPTYSATALNGLPGVLCTAGFFSTPAVLSCSKFAVFAVAALSGGSNSYSRIISHYDGGSDEGGTGVAMAIQNAATAEVGAYQGGFKSTKALAGFNAPARIASVFDGVNHTMYVNNVAGTSVAFTSALGGTSDGALIVGGKYTGVQLWQYQPLSEVFIVDLSTRGALTTDELAAIDAYLVAEWAL